MADGPQKTSAAAMTMPLMKLFKKLHTPVISRGSRGSPTPNQRRVVHGEVEEEEFGYQTTRCLSSYYSIFVARLAIMVMLAILIGMLTILTWHLTRVYTTKSINTLAYGLRYELLQRPILRMWSILNSTVEIAVAEVKLSEYVIGRYENPVSRAQQAELHQAMRDITWAVFASRKALNTITISYRNGFVQAFHRERRSNATFYIYSELVDSSAYEESKAREVQLPISKDDNISAIWYEEPLDPITGEKKGNRRRIPPDDLINIAGIPEVCDGAASWRVVVSKSTDSPLLSAALPVRHPSGGNIVAAVGVTTALKSVGQLMRELVDFHSGYMYLTSREGYVLATSTNAPLLRNTTSGLKLMMANDSKDHMIRSGAEWLEQAYGNQFPISHEVHAENVLLGNQRYYIDSFFLNLKRLPLVGVIIIPRKYIMGKVDQIGFTTLIISISASMCILAIGCVCILILTSGVSKAMKLKAELISHLDARRRAEASSNYKSQFLANMSHELRTPMAAVIGLLDILTYDNCLTNEQLATVTQIRRCSTALLRLLNNILDLSKVESGKLVLEEAEFDLRQELEGLVDMFSVQCINHNMEIILELSDDMPKVVRGDSARVVQIFTNLISNSIKFTLEGHIILRGWCESSIHSSKPERPNDPKESQCALRSKSKQHERTTKRDCKRNDKVTLWFEVEDTGCGIEPSKWETVFESFEQADPSTTRTHGGTGLGLCIVRNFVNKMGGEIKVVKKNGPGTLMQLYLVLGIAEGRTGKHFQEKLSKQSLMVLLALHGTKGRLVMSQWLRENGICTWEASEWNALTQILQQVFQANVIAESGSVEFSTSGPVRSSRMRGFTQEVNQNVTTPTVVIAVDTDLLDQSSNIWKEQLVYLDKYRGKAKFTWVLSHSTSNAIKVELRRKGHFSMVNKPLYKTKMIQILETVIQEGNFENQRDTTSENTTMLENLHEFHEIDPIPFDTVSSDDSDTSDTKALDSRRNAFPTGEKPREIISVSHLPHYPTPNSRKASSQAASLDNILQNPNIMMTREKIPDILKDPGNYGDKSIDCSRRYVHHKGIKQNIISSMEEKLKVPESQLAIGSFEKCSNVFVEMNQLHIGEENMIEQEYQCPSTCTKNDIDYMKKKSTEYRIASVSSISQAEQMKKQLSPPSLPELACKSLQYSEEECLARNNMVPHKNPLEGLSILLAEDTPILQRVATAMLEKVGARVVAVGDGMQAVDAMRYMFCAAESRRQPSTQQDTCTKTLNHLQENPRFDLILMDCQMPKLDGYEATKAIRILQAGTGSHIPIVAVTAHAMSSDEAKCLEVGMDAYLTKPIDSNLMVSTILSLTKRRYF